MGLDKSPGAGKGGRQAHQRTLYVVRDLAVSQELPWVSDATETAQDVLTAARRPAPLVRSTQAVSPRRREERRRERGLTEHGQSSRMRTNADRCSQTRDKSQSARRSTLSPSPPQSAASIPWKNRSPANRSSIPDPRLGAAHVIHYPKLLTALAPNQSVARRASLISLHHGSAHDIQAPWQGQTEQHAHSGGSVRSQGAFDPSTLIVCHNPSTRSVAYKRT